MAAIINYVGKGNSREALRPSATSVHRSSDFAQSPICPAGKLSVCLWARAYGLWVRASCRRNYNMRPTAACLSCTDHKPASQIPNPAPASPQTLTWSGRCSGGVCTARLHSETSWPPLLFRIQLASFRAHHMHQAQAPRRLFQARQAGRVAGRYAYPYASAARSGLAHMPHAALLRARRSRQHQIHLKGMPLDRRRPRARRCCLHRHRPRGARCETLQREPFSRACPRWPSVLTRVQSQAHSTGRNGAGNIASSTMVREACRVASPDQHALTAALVSAQTEVEARYERMLVMASLEASRNSRVCTAAEVAKTS